jgi:hypothetical protein
MGFLISTRKISVDFLARYKIDSLVFRILFYLEYVNIESVANCFGDDEDDRR